MFKLICPLSPNEYFDLHFDMFKLIQYEDTKKCNYDKNVIDLLFRLNSYCMVLTQSCIELIWPGFVWQAEILERSLLEATVKLIYITVDKLKISQKVEEFQYTISNINHYKRQKELTELLDGVKNFNELDKHAFQTVVNNDVDMKLNQQERKKILEKWSFNSMTKEIDSYNIEGLNKLSYFQNYYSNTSHYIHVDIDCLDLFWERGDREKTEKDTIELAHMGRELEDIFYFNIIRTERLMNLFNINISNLNNYLESRQDFIEEIKSLSKKWNDYYDENYFQK